MTDESQALSPCSKVSSNLGIGYTISLAVRLPWKHNQSSILLTNVVNFSELRTTLFSGLS